MERVSPKRILNHAPRTIIGFHGCTKIIAEQILNGQEFRPSEQAYDWLGNGVYFWEYAPYRAYDWAKQKCHVEGGDPAILRASITLGKCLNLLDSEHFTSLERIYQKFASVVEDGQLPQNTDNGAPFLDREIIDAYCRATVDAADNSFQTVRGSFPEGDPIYPGSKILIKAHTQIAVRDMSCIKKITLVQLP